MLNQTTQPLAGQAGLDPVRRDDILALVHRATFGYTTDEHTRATTMGFNGWRDEQLDPASIDDTELDTALAALPSLAMDAATLLSTYPPGMNGDVVVATQLQAARVLRAVYSKRQLFERVVEFWTDHFNIFGLDGAQRYLKTVDDREVIRTHALGRFRDLLGASAKSGAMLLYLDNATSVSGAPNENYSRELMELHTLGSDGGYTEVDVAEVARCLTGWTIFPVGTSNAAEFRFDSLSHDNKAKTVLGQFIPAGGGQQDGETVLDILAAHPATAARIAAKLCTYFLGYGVPTATVDRVAARFLVTDGDIKETLKEVLSIVSFAEINVSIELKLRRPLHLAAGAVRSTGAILSSTQGLTESMRLMGQLPFGWPAPNGYPDSLGAWGSNLLPRWTFASELLNGQVDGVEVPVAALQALFGGAPPARRAEALSGRLTGGRMSLSDVRQVQAFLDAQPGINATVAREAVALALSLPSTQWI